MQFILQDRHVAEPETLHRCHNTAHYLSYLWSMLSTNQHTPFVTDSTKLQPVDLKLKNRTKDYFNLQMHQQLSSEKTLYCCHINVLCTIVSRDNVWTTPY